MPLPSPTTTSAVKLKRRPPLTTLATRRGAAAITDSSSRHLVPLQRQAAFPRAIGKCRNPAVILVATPVENSCGDTRADDELRKEHADPPGLGCLVACRATDAVVHGGRRHHRAACRVVNQLGDQMPRGPADHESWPPWVSGDPLAHPQVPPGARRSPHGCSFAGSTPRNAASHLLLPSLSDLAADLLALVSDALALVGIGLAKFAHLGGDLADLLFVDALHREPGWRLNRELDAVRRLDGDRMAEPEGELQVGASGLDPVTDADDLQRRAVSRGHASDHVRDQASGQAMQRAVGVLVIRPGDGDNTALVSYVNRGHHTVAERALRARHRDHPAVDLDVNPTRHRDRHPSNA